MTGMIVGEIKSVTSVIFSSKSVSNFVSVRVPAGNKITPDDSSDKILVRRLYRSMCRGESVWCFSPEGGSSEAQILAILSAYTTLQKAIHRANPQYQTIHSTREEKGSKECQMYSKSCLPHHKVTFVSFPFIKRPFQKAEEI